MEDSFKVADLLIYMEKIGIDSSKVKLFPEPSTSKNKIKLYQYKYPNVKVEDLMNLSSNEFKEKYPEVTREDELDWYDAVDTVNYLNKEE